jgi:hypothetical protein
MKRIGFALVLASVVGWVGCNKPLAPTNDSPAAITGDHDHDHDHSHDHGQGAHDHSVAGHAHGVGPHAGTIADWGGGKYHVELTVDHDKQQATVYILGSDERSPTPIDASSIELSILEPAMQVILQASPQAGDPEGRASRFVGTDEKLAMVQEYAGTMTGVVDGTPYSGDFKEEPQAGGNAGN